MTKLLKIFSIIVLFSSQNAFAADYAVIANAANGASADSQSEVKNLFLKKKTAWPGGAKAVPLGRKSGSAEQDAFNAAILGMSSGELSGHWQAEKQKTGQTPPKEVGSESILLRQVKRKEGAFGVVPASTTLPDGVKVLFKFSN